MAVLAGILLVLAVVAFVAGPLLTGRAAPLTDGPDRLGVLRELYALRDVTYETLRDLEFDHHAGKISDADYDELRERYRAEAVALVGRIAALEPAGPAPAAR
jgi:hypothetical protein